MTSVTPEVPCGRNDQISWHRLWDEHATVIKECHNCKQWESTCGPSRQYEKGHNRFIRILYGCQDTHHIFQIQVQEPLSAVKNGTVRIGQSNTATFSSTIASV